MKPRISMITLGVRDLERAVKFYGEGLGFPMMETSPGVAFFPLNGTWLSLYPREALAEDARVSPEGSGFESFTLAHNVQSEAEVDEAMARAVRAGATAAKQPEKGVLGRLQRLFQGPGRPSLGSGVQPPFLGRPPGRPGVKELLF